MTRYFIHLVFLSLSLSATGKVIPRRERLSASIKMAGDAADERDTLSDLSRGLYEGNGEQSFNDRRLGNDAEELINFLASDGREDDANEVDRSDPSYDSVATTNEEDTVEVVRIPSSDKNALDNIIEINDHDGDPDLELIEGDIKADLLSRDARKRDATIEDRLKWPKPGNFVLLPHTTVSIGDGARKILRAAMDNIQRFSCVRFIPRTTETDYLNFFIGNGCWSYIGKAGGRQEVSLGSGCEYIHLVIHELYHALGFWHEQSRPDRDNYVTIHWENIPRDKAYHFDTYDAGKADFYGGAYDRLSIMHFGNYAFSIDPQKRTIDWKANPSLPLSGTQLSSIDIQQLNALYRCNRHCDAFGASTETVLNTVTLGAQLSEGLRFFTSSSAAEVALRVFNFVTLCQYTDYYAVVVVSRSTSATALHDFGGSGSITALIATHGRNTVVYTKLRSQPMIDDANQRSLLSEVVAANANQICDAQANKNRALSIVSGKAFFVLVVQDAGSAAQQSGPNFKSGTYPCRSCSNGNCANLEEKVYLGF